MHAKSSFPAIHVDIVYSILYVVVRFIQESFLDSSVERGSIVPRGDRIMRYVPFVGIKVWRGGGMRHDYGIHSIISISLP